MYINHVQKKTHVHPSMLFVFRTNTFSQHVFFFFQYILARSHSLFLRKHKIRTSTLLYTNAPSVFGILYSDSYRRRITLLIFCCSLSVIQILVGLDFDCRLDLVAVALQANNGVVRLEGYREGLLYDRQTLVAIRADGR